MFLLDRRTHVRSKRGEARRGLNPYPLPFTLRTFPDAFGPPKRVSRQGAAGAERASERASQPETLEGDVLGGTEPVLSSRGNLFLIMKPFFLPVRYAISSWICRNHCLVETQLMIQEDSSVSYFDGISLLLSGLPSFRRD